MIRAVFDTNIVVSGLLWLGAPSQAIDAAIDEKFLLLSSEALIAELIRVLSRPKFEPRFKQLGKTVEGFVSNYRALVELVDPVAIQPVITADPTDDAVLACAISAHADFIVSGDKHLLTLGIYETIPILTINEFVVKIANPTE